MLYTWKYKKKEYSILKKKKQFSNEQELKKPRIQIQFIAKQVFLMKTNSVKFPY